MSHTPAPDVGRGTRALIDLSALRHNLDVIRRTAPGSEVLAVVKANAYGHDLDMVVPALRDAPAFAVATVDEAMAVRGLSSEARIVLLEGVATAEDLHTVDRLGGELVVHAPHQIEMLAACRPRQPLRVWVKVDTGMHRLGLDPREAVDAWRRLSALESVAPQMVLLSHLADADDLQRDKTRRQLEALAAVRAELGNPPTSMANSAGVFGWPETHFDWVRPGLALYGASPLMARSAAQLGLRPVMSLCAQLIAVRQLRRGDEIGYGSTFTCPEDMPVGVVGIGYGDGYPRHMGPDAQVSVQGARCSLLGRVSMDMISIDLRPAPEATVGDTIELWGRHIPIDEAAAWSDTIAYTLMCGITQRVARIAA